MKFLWLAQELLLDRRWIALLFKINAKFLLHAIFIKFCRIIEYTRILIIAKFHAILLRFSHFSYVLTELIEWPKYIAVVYWYTVHPCFLHFYVYPCKFLKPNNLIHKNPANFKYFLQAVLLPPKNGLLPPLL